jgi:hypothetical protein
MRNRDRDNPVVALADALREAHPSMFGGAKASSVEEADALYERVANRLINLGVRPGTVAESAVLAGQRGRAGDPEANPPLRGRPPGWTFTIERAWNGYVVSDTTRVGGWLIAGDDPLEAARLLLVELNERLGTNGTPDDEWRVLIEMASGDDWLAAHPALCPHDIVRNREYIEDESTTEGWSCGCGLGFVPVAPSVDEAGE